MTEDVSVDESSNRVTAFALRAGSTLGLRAVGGEELTGGNENHAVRLRAEDRDVVLRFPRPAATSHGPFEVEEWCSTAAKDAGIPTPAVIASGNVDAIPVIVHDFVEGTPASPDDLNAWHAAGALAALLPAVQTGKAPDSMFSRFGRDLSSAWSWHIAYNRAALRPGDALLELGVYSASDTTHITGLLDRLAGRKLHQGLVHSDLSTRNLIAQDAGNYVVIDWGAAQLGPTPWTDLERIRRWWWRANPESCVTEASYSAALRGAGITVEVATPILDELAVLQSLDVLRWALDGHPERVSELLGQSRRTIARVLEWSPLLANS